MNNYQNDNLRRETEEVLLPAVREFQLVLANYVKKADQDMGFELSFKLASREGDGRVQAFFVCPHEFGNWCDFTIESILAFGGTCEEGIFGCVCELPDPDPDPTTP